MKKNNRIKLLDVTLRETPIFIYGTENIRLTLSDLEKAGIDVIEVAFLGSQKTYSYKVGSTHVNTIAEASSFIHKKEKDTIYTVCVNGSSYDMNSLPDASEFKIDAIRYVLFEEKFDEEIADLKIIKEKGYKLFVQHRNILSYSNDEILRIVRTINEIGTDAYSIVDTHGALYPQDVRKLVSLIKPILDYHIWFGYHGHNNHMMANSNAELFLELTEDRDVVFVDGSVMGAGIGAGNANTELLALYCNKVFSTEYAIDYIYDLIDEVIPNLKSRCKLGGYTGEFLVSGEHNVLISQAKYLKEKLKDPRLKNINCLLAQMPENLKYSDRIDFWEEYRDKFKVDPMPIKILKRIGHLKFLAPIRELYLKLRK